MTALLHVVHFTCTRCCLSASERAYVYVRVEVEQLELTQAEVSEDVAHGQLVSAERAQRGGVGAEADPGAVDAVDRAKPLAEAG